MGRKSQWQRAQDSEAARQTRKRHEQEARMTNAATALYNQLIGQPAGVQARFMESIGDDKVKEYQETKPVLDGMDVPKILATLYVQDTEESDWHFYGDNVLADAQVEYKIFDQKAVPTDDDLKFILGWHFDHSGFSDDKKGPCLLDLAMQYVPLEDRSKRLPVTITYPISYDMPAGVVLVKHWPEIATAENIALAFRSIEAIGEVTPTEEPREGRKPFDPKENTLRSWVHFLYACTHQHPELVSDEQVYKLVELGHFWPHYNVIAGKGAGIQDLIGDSQKGKGLPIKPRFAKLDFGRIARSVFANLAKFDFRSSTLVHDGAFLLEHFGKRHEVFVAALPCAPIHYIFVGSRINGIICGHPTILAKKDWELLKAYMLGRSDHTSGNPPKGDAIAKIAEAAKSRKELEYPFNNDFLRELLDAHAPIATQRRADSGRVGSAYESTIALAAKDFPGALSMREIDYIFDEAWEDLTRARNDSYSTEYCQKNVRNHLLVLGQAMTNDDRLASDVVEDYTVKFDQILDVSSVLITPKKSSGEIVHYGGYDERKKREEKLFSSLEVNILLLAVPGFVAPLMAADFLEHSRLYRLSTLAEQPLPKFSSCSAQEKVQGYLQLTVATLQQISPLSFESSLFAQVESPTAEEQFAAL